MSNVLPLNLTATEEYYLVQDMQVALELTFDGRVDQAALEFGLSEALKRHPLLSAVVERRGFLRPRWIQRESARPRVICQGVGHSFGPLEYEPLNLATEPGIRFYVQVGPERSRMIVLFHHACCDAQGVIQFMGDLFAGYVWRMQPAGQPQPHYAEVIPERLARRDKFSIHIPTGINPLRFVARMLELSSRILFRPADPLAAPATAPHAAERASGTETRMFEPYVFRTLRRLARQKGATVNDLFLREMFLALRDWNRRHAPDAPERRLIQAVPVNLRNLQHDRMPAANIMTSWYCNRPVADCDDPDALLASIHEESVFLKNSRLCALLTMSLEVLRWVPGLLRFLTSRGDRFATIVMSNVGDTWRACTADFPTDDEGYAILANLVLKGVNSASALPTGNLAAFTVWHASDKLRIGLKCDGRAFSQADAEALLETYASRILALADAAANVSGRKAA